MRGRGGAAGLGRGFAQPLGWGPLGRGRGRGRLRRAGGAFPVSSSAFRCFGAGAEAGPRPPAGPAARLAAPEPGGAAPARSRCAAPAPAARRDREGPRAAQLVGGRWNTARPGPLAAPPPPSQAPRRLLRAPAGSARDAPSPLPGAPGSSSPRPQTLPVRPAAGPPEPWGRAMLGAGSVTPGAHAHFAPGVRVSGQRSGPVPRGRAGVAEVAAVGRGWGPLPGAWLFGSRRLCVEGAVDSLQAQRLSRGQGMLPAPPHPHPPPSTPGSRLRSLTWLVCSQYCSFLPLRMRGSTRW